MWQVKAYFCNVTNSLNAVGWTIMRTSIRLNIGEKKPM